MLHPRRALQSQAWLLSALLWVAPRAEAQMEASSALYVRVEDGLVRVAIETRVAPGWHLYHGPTKADLGDGGGIGTETVIELAADGVEWAPVRFPRPKKLPQPLPDNPQGWIYGHEGTLVFHALGRAEGAIAAEDVTAEITGLTCEDSGQCIPYSEELAAAGSGADRLFTKFPADLTADAIGQKPEAPAITSPAASSGDTGGSRVDWAAVQFADYAPVGGGAERSLLLWLVLAFVAGGLLTSVGLGMAAPYVLLTSNPALLKYVPKPGAWMQTFKHLMGFLLLATVVFLMVSVRQDMLLFLVTFLIFVGLACWQWGRYAKFDQPLPRRLATAATTLLIVLIGARFSFVDFRGVFAPPDGARGHLAWEDFDPVALQRYHDEGRGVMVDFTADWCANCKLNEQLVYESQRIRELLLKKGVVPMKADTTHGGPKTEAIERLMRELGGSGIPFMAIFPGADWRRPHIFYDIVTRGQVAKVLETLPDAATSLVGAR